MRTTASEEEVKLILRSEHHDPFHILGTHQVRHEGHIDGLRVDAVASMLYLDYSRKPGATAESAPYQNRPCSIQIVLPPPRAVYFRREGAG